MDTEENTCNNFNWEQDEINNIELYFNEDEFKDLGYSEEMIAVLKRMIALRPKDRATVKEILEDENYLKLLKKYVDEDMEIEIQEVN